MISQADMSKQSREVDNIDYTVKKRMLDDIVDNNLLAIVHAGREGQLGEV